MCADAFALPSSQELTPPVPSSQKLENALVHYQKEALLQDLAALKVISALLQAEIHAGAGRNAGGVGGWGSEGGRGGGGAGSEEEREWKRYTHTHTHTHTHT